MSDLGELIFRVADEQGEVHVYQDARLRYLTFGNQVEQSCVDLDRPARLQHVYTQAMLLALLLVDGPRDALLLGLGGGSLARALRAADRGIWIRGIEQRAAVIDAARAYFRLPDDRRFDVVCSDAADFLAVDSGYHDLIFADLYLATGMYPQQASAEFLQLCRGRLTARGVLVVNLWASDYPAHREASAALHGVFDGEVVQTHVQGGNILAFAFAETVPAIERVGLFEAAQTLGLRLEIPLQRHARNLWRQNSDRLRSGPSRRRG